MLTQEMDEMIEWLGEECESIFKDGTGQMSVSQGKVRMHLGVTLDCTTPGQVETRMLDCILEILVAFEKAAPANLFKVDEDCEQRSEKQAKEFHNLVTKTLCGTKRARPDTCTSVAFLTTRVRKPDNDDWAKMVNLMKCLRGTKKPPLILGANGSGTFRGHTEGGLSLGRGFPAITSKKQKPNTRSSAETDIVGVDDCMPSVLQTRQFVEAQGHGIQENTVCQDNQSAILMEKNSKASSSKRTKHANICCCFVTDRIRKKDLTVEWCPTGDMIGDFMTKANQGALFAKFGDQIVGVIPAKSPGPGKVKKDKMQFFLPEFGPARSWPTGVCWTNSQLR
jgi:hypothetical protein